jgi:hypothetical protein
MLTEATSTVTGRNRTRQPNNPARATSAATSATRTTARRDGRWGGRTLPAVETRKGSGISMRVRGSSSGITAMSADLHNG